MGISTLKLSLGSVIFSSLCYFLGHVLSGEGIPAKSENVDEVSNWSVPKDVKELHSFFRCAA